MAKVVRLCGQCQGSFSVYQSQVNRGGGKFCSVGCGTTYRNIHNNPTKCKNVRMKISKNHADVSGKNNPMYGMRGFLAPSFKGSETYREKAFRCYGKFCNRCESEEEIEVHHIDRDRENNQKYNLEVLCKACHLEEHRRELIMNAYTRKCPDTGRFLKGDVVNG